jgi:hypothetical protein
MIILGKDTGVFVKTTISALYSGAVTASFTGPHTITFTSLPNTSLRTAVLTGLSIVITGTSSNNGTFHYSASDVSAQAGGSFSIVLTETVITEASGTITVNVYASSTGSDLYTPFICGKSCTLNIETELIEITTASSTAFRDFEPQYHSWGISFDGNVSVDETGTLSVDDVTDFQVNKTKLFVRVKAVKKGLSTFYFWDGEGYIKSSSLVAQDNNTATFSFTIQGTGALTKGNA